MRRNRGRHEEAEEDQDAPHHGRLENGLGDSITIRPEDRPPSLLRRIVAHDAEIRGEGEGQVPWTKEVHGTPPLGASREFVLKEVSITEFIACHPRWVPSTLGVLREETANREPRLLRRGGSAPARSEEHTSELQSPCNLVCRLLLEKKKKKKKHIC